MKSMTGYAYRETTNDTITVSVEIKGYNSRFLDLSVYLPSWLSVLESEIRNYMRSRFARGKVDVSVRINEKNPQVNVLINESAAETYITTIRNLAKKLELKEEPSLGLILGLEGVLEIEADRDIEKYRDIIEKALYQAADQFEAERVREGKHTEDDILSHLALVEESVKSISSHAPELEAAIKENLRSRFAELLGEKIDESRVLAETAVLLVKYTISEELSRLESHLKEFRLETGRNPSPGKKLDFLSQEISREINTIGSKTPVLDVSLKVVEMKNALENIKEQLRNVE